MSITDQKWYSITAKAESEADVMIYDEIGGFGISAESFVKDLGAIKANVINVHMNTPGGGVFEGTAIYNAFKAHPAKIIMHIDGLAASMGSFIAMAGDEIRIAKSAFMMIHNPSGLVCGDAASMRDMANLLDKLKGVGAQVYADRTGKPKDYWMGKMDETAWYSAEEAKVDGLADVIVDEDPQSLAVAASFDLSTFKNLPANLQKQIQAVSINSLGRTQATSRDVAVKATITEFKMTDELFSKYAAENPESAAVKALHVRGKNAGSAEAHQQEVERMKSLVAACPNRPALAISSFIAGRDADAVKDTVAELDREKAANDAEKAQMKAELAKAQFNAGTQGAVGTAGATAEVAANANKAVAGKPDLIDAGNGKPTTESARALAEWQWDNEKPPGFSSKANYVNVRVAEFSGQFKARGETIVKAA